MRLVLFTDLHGSESALASVLEKARSADLILFAGDINSYEGTLEKMLGSLARAKKTCLIVHGNHDDPEQMRSVCQKYPNLVYLHKGVYEFQGVKFFGHGGGGFSRTDRDFEALWAKFLRKELDKGQKSVLITHAPPYGTKVDSLYGEFRGNETYRHFLDEHQPLLHVCGHFHENFGKTDHVRNTLVINPGPQGVLIDI